MEGNNCGAEVTKAEVSSTPNQPAMTSVPDVINIPAASAQATATKLTIASTTPKSVPVTTTATTDGPVQLPSASKSTPTSTVKSAPAPPQPNPNIPRATSLPSAASEASVKNRSTREEKARKKDDKSAEHVLRAVNSLHTNEERVAALCKKYTELNDEHRKLQVLQKQTEKRCSILQREKEQLTGEQSKAILTRSRLENLCRELQRQNKAIKDESLLKIREEEEKRKDVSAKFQTTMNEITSLMQQNNDKNMKLRDDNIYMTEKLKSICEQYELRQQQVDRVSKQMQLEQQLADAKLSKLKLEMAAERETLLKEKQQLLLELQQYQQRCTEFQGTEVNLRNQISMYNDKYDEFQKALARSNDVFGGFKGEMEKMSKKICKLEKETSSWKQRWERSHNALLEMGADKQKSEQELVVVSRQLTTLQGLCRTLQAERATLTAKLKILQAGEQDSLEKNVVNYLDKVNKQTKLDQALNHVEPVELSDKSSNFMGKTDTLLKHCNQDILSSFENIVAAKDSSVCSKVSATTNSAAPETVQAPSLANPLPDVVGASSTCVLEQKPDVNSALAQQFQNITFAPNALEEEKSTSIQANDSLKTNVPAMNEVPNTYQPSNIETSNQPSPILENKVPEVTSTSVITVPQTISTPMITVLQMSSPPVLDTVPQAISTPVITVPQTISPPVLDTLPQAISTPVVTVPQTISPPVLDIVPQVISTPVLNTVPEVNSPQVLNTVSQVTSTPVLNTVPQVTNPPVLNGDAQMNNLLKPDQNLQKDVSSPKNQPSKSPTPQCPAKSPETGKKTKEPAKKKKK